MAASARASVAWDCGMGCPLVHLSVPVSLEGSRAYLRIVVDEDAVRLAVVAHYQGTHQGQTP